MIVMKIMRTRRVSVGPIGRLMRSDGRSFNIQDSLQPESGVEPGRLKWVIRQLEVRNTPAHFIRDLANAGEDYRDRLSERQ